MNTPPATTPHAPSGSVAALCPSVVNDDRLVLMGLLTEVTARLHRVLGQEMERDCGIPLAWFEVLVRLVRSPAGHLTMSEVADQTVYTSGGTTRLVDRIEEAGLVRPRHLTPRLTRAHFFGVGLSQIINMRPVM
jgi:hypothetical protein